MQKRNLFALTAVGLAAAIAVPTIAFGNARPNPNQATQTPLVARLLGSNEVPTTRRAQRMIPMGSGPPR